MKTVGLDHISNVIRTGNTVLQDALAKDLVKLKGVPWELLNSASNEMKILAASQGLFLDELVLDKSDQGLLEGFIDSYPLVETKRIIREKIREQDASMEPDSQ